MAVILATVGAVTARSFGGTTAVPTGSVPIREATVYKSPTCGCCGSYISYLRQAGYDVTEVTTDDLQQIRDQYQVPAAMASCHTMVIDRYVVEGHVPLEAVETLLKQRPSITGIALPGMPTGSPGMPGTKRGAFRIYSFTNGVTADFMSL